VLPAAEAANVELHLETDLGPADFAALLARVGHPLLRVNYDTGNSASLGYDPAEEVAAYGELIASVHVKDRVRGGGTVPLGEGHARIREQLGLLRKRGYSGDLVLQVARGRDGDEVELARRNAQAVRELWEA
jgi:L-ribulose-5-phosphate 3-epimerase